MGVQLYSNGTRRQTCSRIWTSGTGRINPDAIWPWHGAFHWRRWISRTCPTPGKLPTISTRPLPSACMARRVILTWTASPTSGNTSSATIPRPPRPSGEGGRWDEGKVLAMARSWPMLEPGNVPWRAEIPHRLKHESFFNHYHCGISHSHWWYIQPARLCADASPEGYHRGDRSGWKTGKRRPCRDGVLGWPVGYRIRQQYIREAGDDN